nr:MAG TPA: hypothetical protein [Caudoviricetes sp.]
MTKIRSFTHLFFASFHFQNTTTNFSSLLYFYITS